MGCLGNQHHAEHDGSSKQEADNYPTHPLHQESRKANLRARSMPPFVDRALTRQQRASYRIRTTCRVAGPMQRLDHRGRIAPAASTMTPTKKLATGDDGRETQDHLCPVLAPMAAWISIGDADHLQQPVLAVSWTVLIVRPRCRRGRRAGTARLTTSLGCPNNLARRFQGCPSLRLRSRAGRASARNGQSV